MIRGINSLTNEKRSICAQTTVRGVSVAQVARRYSMNANLIHNWLKDARFAPEPEMDKPACNGGFLPVEIEGAIAVPMVNVAQEAETAVSAQRVDITLSDGRRILIEGPTALSSVLALVGGMMT